MRRPLTVIGFTAMPTLIAVSLLPLNAALVTGIFAIFVGAIILFVKETRRFAMLALALLSVGVSCVYYFTKSALVVQPAELLAGHTAKISGTLVEEPETNGERHYYVVETDFISLTGAPDKVKVRLFSNDFIDMEAYDTFSGEVTFYETADMAKNGYRAQGIYISGFFSGYPEVTEDDKRPLGFQSIRIRRYVRSSVDSKFLPEIAGVIKGVILGDTSSLTDQTRDDFRRIGVSHLFAVSGMHLSIIMQFVMLLLGFFGVSKRVSAGISIALVVFFMAVTGFPFSAVRAGIMCIIYLTAQIIRRESDSLNSLAVALIYILAVNPFSATDIGLMMSAATNLGIILLCDKLSSAIFNHMPGRLRFPKIIRFFSMSVACSLSAGLFILPVSVLIFGEVSLISPVANLIIAPVASLMLCLAVLAVLFSPVEFFVFIYNPLFFIAGLLSKFCLALTQAFASLPFASASTNYKYIQVWLGLAVILIALALLFKNRRRMLRLAALLSCVLLLCGMVSYSVFDAGVTRIAVIDVGNGSSVMLYKAGHGVLVGCGGDRYAVNNVRSFMKDSGVTKLNALILPSLEPIHAAGAVEICREENPQMLVIPDEGLYFQQLSSLRMENVEYREMNNQTITVLDGITIDIFVTEKGPLISCKINNTSVLLSCPSADLRAAPKGYDRADLLLCTSALPLSAAELTPEFAVVSGDERFGTAAAAGLASQGITSYSTAGAGSIVIKTRGRGDLMAERIN